MKASLLQKSGLRQWFARQKTANTFLYEQPDFALRFLSFLTSAGLIQGKISAVPVESSIT
jgi:hypothetical protein